MIKEIAACSHVSRSSSLAIVNVIVRINRRDPTCTPAQHMQHPARRIESENRGVSTVSMAEALWVTWK